MGRKNTDKIVKAVFYIEPRREHNRVQNIGCRMLITEKMLLAGFSKGGVFNIPDGRVEVVLEGKEKDVRAFHENVRQNLVQWLEERAREQDKMEHLRSAIGNPGITVTRLEIKEGLHILDIKSYSHSLQLNQMQKGVDAYLRLTGAINHLTEVLDRKIG